MGLSRALVSKVRVTQELAFSLTRPGSSGALEKMKLGDFLTMTEAECRMPNRPDVDLLTAL
jgi:hypothetical protein